MSRLDSHIGVRIPVSQSQQLRAIAERRGVTVGEVVRVALSLYLRRYERNQETR